MSRLGRHLEAIPFAGKALELAEKTVGPESSATAQQLNNLALLYFRSGRAKTIALIRSVLAGETPGGA